MLITDSEKLKSYGATERLWQGIPSIEVTQGGRIFVTFYSGGTKEELGNYSLLIKSDDGGESFSEPVAVAREDGGRTFDEHMIVEMKDGSLRMFVRTKYGIGASNSYDGGKSWGVGFDTGYGGPSSRFHICRLRSGRLLLINHYDYKGRNNLYAMLSEDDGVTFPYKLLLDGRNLVSYPDAKEAEDGYIYITYDRERGGFLSSMEEVMKTAREILVTRIREEDIIRGEIKSEGCFTARIASKLGAYEGEDKNPYKEKGLYSSEELAAILGGESEADAAINEIFDTYHLNCTNLHNLDSRRLDELIEKYREKKELSLLSSIISLVRSATVGTDTDETDTVNAIRVYIMQNLAGNESTEEIALKFNYSANYIHHVFKKKTGTTIVKFRNEQRLIKAKLLLCGCDGRITDIAAECGFENPAYFTEVFTKEVGISPREYRSMHRK